MRQRNWWTSPCSYEGIKRFSLLPPPWIQRCMLDQIRSCSSTTAALRRLWVVRHQPQSGEKETLQTAPRVGQDPWRRFTTHYVCLLWTDTSYIGDKYSPLSHSLHFQQTPIVRTRSTEATLLALKLQDQVQSLLKQCSQSGVAPLCPAL